MAKKITIICENALVSAAVYGIVNRAFNAYYFRDDSKSPNNLYCDGYDAERIVVPAVEAVLNSVISPKVYSIISEEIEEPQEQ